MAYPGETSVYNENDVRAVIPESHDPVIEVWAAELKYEKSYWQVGSSQFSRIKLTELAANVRIKTEDATVLVGTATENFEPVETLGTVVICLCHRFYIEAHVTKSSLTAPLVVGGILGSNNIQQGYWILDRREQKLKRASDPHLYLPALPGSSYIADYVTKLRDSMRKIKAEKKGVWATVSRRLIDMRPYLHRDLINDDRSSVINVLNDYTDCFYRPGDKIRATKLFKCPLKTKGNDVINIRQPNFSEDHWDRMDIVISDLLRQGILRVSTSPYNFPVGLLDKKPDSRGNVDVRLSAGYTPLNNLIEPESFPIPSIVDAVDELYGSKYFTVLDLASASYHIPLEPRDCRKTAFTVRSGRYEFSRMPSGIKNGAEYIQRFMNRIFEEMRDRVFVCRDDILVHSPTIEQHEITVRNVLNRIRDNGVKLQPSKCQMFQKSVIYLGFLITDEGLLPDPAKIEKLKTPRPETSDELRSYLGLLSTHNRFICNYASRAKPLWDLLKKPEFLWTRQTIQNFNDFQTILSKSLLLSYPDWNRPFFIRTGFEEHGVWAGLVQKNTDDNLLRPIAWASRTYTPAETHCETAKQKELASAYGMDTFRRYVQNTVLLNELAQNLSIKN